MKIGEEVKRFGDAFQFGGAVATGECIERILYVWHSCERIAETAQVTRRRAAGCGPACEPLDVPNTIEAILDPRTTTVIVEQHLDRVMPRLDVVNPNQRGQQPLAK